MKIKVNDTVLVTKGKDRGKTGKVLRTDKKKERIVVEGTNILKKHVKGRGNIKSDIIQFEGSLSASNVLLICPHCQKKTRIGYNVNKDGRKQRICKKCNETVDQAREIKKVRK